MHLSLLWAGLASRPSPSITSAFIWQAAAHFPHPVHEPGSMRGMKWGGAIIPGASNSLTVLKAPQQHPQQEQAQLPMRELSEFIIQVTSPSFSAAALTSSTSFMLARRIRPCSASFGASGPITVHVSSILPHPSPTTCLDKRHWQTPIEKSSQRSSITSSLSEGRAIGSSRMTSPTGR